MMQFWYVMVITTLHQFQIILGENCSKDNKFIVMITDVLNHLQVIIIIHVSFKQCFFCIRQLIILGETVLVIGAGPR